MIYSGIHILYFLSLYLQHTCFFEYQIGSAYAGPTGTSFLSLDLSYGLRCSGGLCLWRLLASTLGSANDGLRRSDIFSLFDACVDSTGYGPRRQRNGCHGDLLWRRVNTRGRRRICIIIDGYELVFSVRCLYVDDTSFVWNNVLPPPPPGCR